MGSDPFYSSGVRIGIITPSRRTLLVYEPSMKDPRLKFPGGRMERGETVRNCAIREGMEELGLGLLPEEIEHVRNEERLEDGTYVSHFCLARISDETYDEHLEKGFEGDRLILVKEFMIHGLSSLKNFLEPHRIFLPYFSGVPA